MPKEASRDAQERRPTCFVITGFGRKTDYATGRVLDLDKTYAQLVRPACDRAGINCFRAIDANITGSIDSIMYKWIYQADFVIADLSTLNANVFYELGVRHAQKPNTTIIIAESVLMQKIPFDLSSFVIHQYEHGGEEIAPDERERFVAHLQKMLGDIMALEDKRQGAGATVPRQPDSPVFTFLEGMAPSDYEIRDQLEPPPYVPPAERAAPKAEEGASLASLIARAEAAKSAKDFGTAIELFQQAMGPGNDKPDLFLAQRLALVTYKQGETKDAAGNVDKEAAIAALHAAEDVLARYCAPKISTDPETLGLSGAINKRLFELTGDLEFLDRAIGFYERGFYVKQDYYNGINVAFMYTIRANLLDDAEAATVSYGHANMVRKRVAEICNELIADEATFQKRGDKQWVLMTLAECYQGMGLARDEERLRPKIEREADEFGRHSYQEQKQKLADAMDAYRARAGGAVAAAVPAVGNMRARVEVPPTSGPMVRRTVTIDADVAKDRVIGSIEVSCKIDYA